MGDRTSIYGVLESTDQIYVNFFTSRGECDTWAQSERMGDTVVGPLEVQGWVQSPPFDIVLGCDHDMTIQEVYSRSSVDNTESKHPKRLGPYTVYDSIQQFDADPYTKS